MENNSEVFLHPMRYFSVQHLRFICKAESAIAFDAQPGTAIRGSLYHALITMFSPNEPIPGLPLDPVRKLLSSQDNEHIRGQDLPRAFTVEPPAAYTCFDVGQDFEFGVSLLGSAINFLPYLLRAVQKAGTLGIGKGRGRFRLIRIDEFSPLGELQRPLIQNDQAVSPCLQVTHSQVEKEALIRQDKPATLQFISPMRLVKDGRLIKKPQLGALLRRLIERAQTLVENESTDSSHIALPNQWKDEWARIGKMGDVLDENYLVYDHTRWIDINSYSQARKRSTPIGGIVGEAQWKEVPIDILIWLLWGQSLHVGKNAVKGDGYFRLPAS